MPGRRTRPAGLPRRPSRGIEMSSATRRARRPIDVWPGYVDVLAALLILVIFVLLLFSFAQFLLSHLLNEQETELDVMYRRVVELTDLLGLEQERTTNLSQRRRQPDRPRSGTDRGQGHARYQGRGPRTGQSGQAGTDRSTTAAYRRPAGGHRQAADAANAA